MITGADYQRAPTAAELLLTMDAVPKRDSVDPRIRIASLVPFGPAPGRGWKMEQWAACWNTAHDDAVAEDDQDGMDAAGKKLKELVKECA
jgi:hypothetical protein